MLDPEVKLLLEFFETLGFPDPAEVTPPELRESFKLPPADNPTPVGAVDTRGIPGPGGDIPVRIYQPDTDGESPVLLYFHGGGWVIGDLDSHDEVCRQLCAGSGIAVVAVAYRLAPEAPFPAPLDDCYAATCWVHEHAAEFGADPARLAVGGDSAGGNLAAAVCLRAREEGTPPIRHQVLIYPVTDRDFERQSYRDNGEGLFLTRDMMLWFWDQYLPGPGDAENPLAVPLAADLAGLPPATVVTAEHDPLRDEGIEYADSLAAAGVAVEQREFKGMIHGFIGMTDALTQARVAVDYLCQRLREQLAE